LVRPSRLPSPTLSPYTTLFRSHQTHFSAAPRRKTDRSPDEAQRNPGMSWQLTPDSRFASSALRVRGTVGQSANNHAAVSRRVVSDRKSTRLNSSHVKITYPVFC